MTDNDYPALYRSASDLSQTSQNAFFHAFLGYSCLLVIASVISVINSPCSEAAIAQALVLALALFGAVYLYVVRPDRHWYSGRAIAESIKTITWRFAMKAEPFHEGDEIARQKFGQKLKAIVSQNLDIAQRLTTHLDGVQITEVMLAMRSLGIDERRKRYTELRIVDQQRWYAKKAAFNRRMVKRFFGLLILVNILAISILSKPIFPFLSNCL